MDQNCLNAGDFTAVRGFVRVESDHVTPDGCILRLPPTQIVDVKLRIVKTWAVYEDFTVPLDGAVDRARASRPRCLEVELQPHRPVLWALAPTSPTSCLPLRRAVARLQPPHVTNFLQPLVAEPLLRPAAAPVNAIVLSDDSNDKADEDDDLSNLSPTVEVSNSFSSLTLSDGETSHASFLLDIPSSLPASPALACTSLGSVVHEATLRRMQDTEERATDAEKLSRSRRLADKEGATIVRMTTKDPHLSPLDVSSLTSVPEEPVHDVAALVQIATLCGPEPDEGAEVSSPAP
ncbi:hypothetical protein D1007_01182 [Hordeum vulgare]|nr:hypothetical protein D1007_01182 [Hordeum vulgare]